MRSPVASPTEVAAPASSQEAHDDAVERFEAAWQSGVWPAIAAFLPPAQPGRVPADDAACRALFHELIKIDLEYRWRRGDQLKDSGVLPRQPRLEHYVALLPG